MTEARLATHVWVGAWMARARLADLPVYVTAKGDPDGGAVMIKCATLDGRATAWGRSYNLMSGTRSWVQLAEGPEPEVDAMLARERARDRDLWLLEVESRSGHTLLDEPGLAD